MRRPGLAPGLVGAFSSLAAIISFAAGATLLWPGSGLDAIWSIRNDDTYRQMLAFRWPAGLGLWLLSAVALMTAAGSFASRRWAWWLAVIALAVNGLADLARLASGGVREGVMGVAIAAAILFWLNRRAVRGQFLS